MKFISLFLINIHTVALAGDVFLPLKAPACKAPKVTQTCDWGSGTADGCEVYCDYGERAVCEKGEVDCDTGEITHADCWCESI